MQQMQDYRPYRTAILTPEELRQLSSLQPRHAIWATIAGWVVIIAAWACVAWNPTWYMAALAIPVIGTRYYALLILGHDGLHRRLFADKSHNDLWNDLFLVGPIGAITRINRTNHIEHHRITSLPTDPDRYKYVHDDKEPIFPFIYFLSGLQSVGRVLHNIFVKPLDSERAGTPSKEKYTARDLAIIGAWQVLLIGGLSLAIGWWAFPVLWVLPVYLFAYRGDLMRVFCEHSMQTSDAEADRAMRLVSYDCNWVERQIFAPHNMNCHIAHHLWPSIPYYALPAAESRIKAWIRQNGQTAEMAWRSSYTGYLLSYARWRLGRADRNLAQSEPA